MDMISVYLRCWVGPAAKARPQYTVAWQWVMCVTVTGRVCVPILCVCVCMCVFVCMCMYACLFVFMCIIRPYCRAECASGVLRMHACVFSRVRYTELAKTFACVGA